MSKKVEPNGIVSVIIPIYQAEKYIKRCVFSVINQTYKDVEILLIDDGSTDNSLNICNELAQEDSRIRVLHQENSGVATARNRGIDCASGEYIFFLDSDDWIEKETLYELKTAMEDSSSDICFCGFCYVNEGDDRKRISSSSAENEIHTFMNEKFWELYWDTILFNIGTKLYKSKIIEEANIRFHTDMVVYEDVQFCMEYIEHTKKVRVMWQEFYNYFVGNNDSATCRYLCDFWASTELFCRFLLEKFGSNDSDAKSAILRCLFRAFLQECHNPQLNKSDFLRSLEENCFMIEKQTNVDGCAMKGKTLPENLFCGLVHFRTKTILWWLTLFVSKRSR